MSNTEKQCFNCGKKGRQSNGLCDACNQRAKRATPQGKLKVKQYNDAARKRFLEKNPRPPKEIKICECGNPASLKLLCRKCYNKFYFSKKNRYKPRQIGGDPVVEYSKILDFVKRGDTIQAACKRVNMCTSKLYRKITKKQKIELKQCKSNNGITSYVDVFLEFDLLQY